MKNIKNKSTFTTEIMNLMKESPTCFHVNNNCKQLYIDNGFVELTENNAWDIKPGKKYFVSRNNSAIASFAIPKTKNINGFMIVASHGDYPAFKVYNNGEFNTDDYFRLASIEPYSKSLNHSWVDVPLSVAGRLILKTKTGVKTQLVNIKRPLLMITSLAPHLTRDNDLKVKLFDYEKHMQPLFSTDTKLSLIDIIAKEANIKKNEICESELFVYRYQDPILWGAHNEFLSSRSIDDQINAYSSTFAIMEAKPQKSIAVNIIFDNEEVGSQTTQGAQSTFLKNVLTKIYTALGFTETQYISMLANSFIVSADNGHSLHPNFPEMHNKEVRTYLGEGVAVKTSASYSYSTNSLTASIIKEIAKKNKVRTQDYYNKCGTMGGGTLTKYIAPYLSINACDIGLAQLAMHSSYETCSIDDAFEMKNLMTGVFNSSIKMKDNQSYIIE